MAFQVAYADDRNIQGIGQGFGIVDSHKECTDQTGALSDGNAGKILPAEACLPQRLAGNLFNRFDMGTGSKLGHDAAESLMHSMLRGNNVRENGPVRCQDRGGSFIARGLDPEDGAKCPG